MTLLPLPPRRLHVAPPPRPDIVPRHSCRLATTLYRDIHVAPTQEGPPLHCEWRCLRGRPQFLPPCLPDASMSPPVFHAAPNSSMSPRRRRGLFSAARGAACAGAHTASPTPPCLPDAPPCLPDAPPCRPDAGGASTARRKALPARAPAIPPPMSPRIPLCRPDAPPCRPDEGGASTARRETLPARAPAIPPSMPPPSPPCHPMSPHPLHVAPPPPCRPEFLYVAPTKEEPLQRGERRCLRGRPQFLPPCRPIPSMSPPAFHASPTPPMSPRRRRGLYSAAQERCLRGRTHRPHVAPTQEGPLQRGERRCLRGCPQFLPPCRPHHALTILTSSASMTRLSSSTSPKSICL
jgi:hypothetical protein